VLRREIHELEQKGKTKKRKRGESSLFMNPKALR
jgi:hypothetical protein